MTRRRFFLSVIPALACALLFGVAAIFPSPPREDAESQLPRYLSGGELVRPTEYRRWVFVGASLGLTYSPAPAATMSGHQQEMFHHTYLAPRAYDEYLRNGEFPEKTMLVLELYEAGEKVEPATGGLFEAQRRAVEVAVKDRERFPGSGWAYFAFGDGRTEAAPPVSSPRCVTCHREHAAHDNVFTQFYPVLRDR